MSYTSVDDVKAEAGFSGNAYIRKNDIQDKIDDAEAIINSYLHGKYTLPFDEYPAAPPLIENISRKLAAAYLLQAEYGPMNTGDSKDGFAKEKSAIAIIEKLQKGTITLCDKDGVSLLDDSKLTTSFLPSDATSNNSTDDESTNDSGPYIKIDKRW